MRILVVGSGGREHALVWSIAGSPLATDIYCAPGNAGIAQDAECVPIEAVDVPALVQFAMKERIDLVVIGPESSLEAGLTDALEAEGILTFGPTKAAAEIETSKGYMKDLCARLDIPTAAYKRFKKRDAAVAYVEAQGAPIVVKADGLAAGKGVVVAETVEEAITAIDACMLDGAFGGAGSEVVVEECLVGEEISYFALVDGDDALPFASAQDHKRAFDGDKGPNTGGMGAYSPAPAMTDALADTVMKTIVQPVIDGLKDDGRPFKGVLFVGLMLTADGPKVIEFNARFGDPEAQTILTRLRSDLLPALVVTAEGGLKHFDLRWRPETSMTVIMATNGYPGPYEAGSRIEGVDRADALNGVTVFHAGTQRDENGLIANGGRVLAVTSLGDDLLMARDRAYAGIETIDWPGGFCRNDIGWRALP
ncbi:MAG: phosphoribosylamine--glycine ligase [Alphaproteobacteria bacterium]